MILHYARIALIAATLPLLACTGPTPPSDEQLQAAFENAVADAAVADPSEISRRLVAITPDNDRLIWDYTAGAPRVLVVTWTSYTGYDAQVGQTLTTARDTWVTVAPEVQQWVATRRIPAADRTLRVEELLGVPPHNGKTRFVEFWVAPADLFRPSADPEITDHEAQIDWPVPADYVTISTGYQQWFINQMAVSYGAAGYPWTRLGYTYDWGDDRGEFGLSEFVIRSGAVVEIHAVSTNEEYIGGAMTGRAQRGALGDPRSTNADWRGTSLPRHSAVRSGRLRAQIGERGHLLDHRIQPTRGPRIPGAARPPP